MNLLTKCPICNASEHSFFIQGKDFTCSNEFFDIVECKSCSFRFTNPIPNEENIGAYYKSENYISHTGTKKGFINKLYHLVRNYTLKQKFNLINSYAKEKSLLDIGCGTGDFLTFTNKKGWKTMGLEPDENVRLYCKSKNNIEVQPPEKLHSIKNKSYNIITLWHVLEHVYHLKKDVEKIKEILHDNGTLFIAVPNCSSYDAKKYKEFWAAYDLPIHLYHFRPNNIKQLFESMNMQVVKTLPMKFDSYYVSLLSEKYKSGKSSISLFGIIKGFFIGLLSNLKANNNSYSSQIYVIQHK